MLLKNAHLRCLPVGNGFKPFPAKDLGRPRKRDFADSTCIWVFLSSLRKNDFFSKLLGIEVT
jgi:hypothetical protein